MTKDNLILILLSALIIAVVYDIVDRPAMISHRENELKIELHDLEQDKALLSKQNNQLSFKIKSFEYEIIKNDSIIDNSSLLELDSLFTEYFKR